MSATELIKQVASLPPEERAKFEHLFRELERGVVTPGQPTAAQWPDFGRRLQAIYGSKLAPDSQSLVEEARGDR